MKKYPDVSELLALKEARRKSLAKLPLEAKMEISNRLRKIARDASMKVSKDKGLSPKPGKKADR
ncbi:MAG: hypothetical protein QOD75_2600 [Blastocatellia bacterium]|jgi:hypothetical protein|nr:hypothetical protein [Blastocatellia bacterium]